MSVAALSEILLPPAMPIESTGNWLAVENKLGTRVPDDFRDFIQCYGSGTIGRFITVLNPFSSISNLNLLDASRLQLEALRDLANEFGDHGPYPLYPDSGGLLPVALTDNGDIIFWLTRGDPNAWKIVVQPSRDSEFEQFDCDLTSFLKSVLDGSNRCKAFPDFVTTGSTEFFPD